MQKLVVSISTYMYQNRYIYMYRYLYLLSESISSSESLRLLLHPVWQLANSENDSVKTLLTASASSIRDGQCLCAVASDR